MRILWFVTSLVTLVACGRPPEAPSELDDLSHYLYGEWGNEDTRVMAAGVENLRAFLRQQDLTTEAHVNDRSWEISSIRAADVKGLERPTERNLSDTIAVGVAIESTYDIDAHAKLQIKEDQLPIEPSAIYYARSFPDLDNPRCFLDPEECPVLATVNDLERKNILMSVVFRLFKDIRWVALDDGSYAMISRSYTKESTEGENGKSMIWQSFSLDAWVPDGDKTLRYQVLWQEADIAGSSDAVQLGTVKSFTDQAYEVTEEFLAGS
jgi:hypothetical protein